MSIPPPAFPPSRRAAFRRALLAWYDLHHRDLPWRRTRDPYAIWLSEVMLQQTTVATVRPRWERFLARWPTLADLAAAPREEVLHEWTGLGYYARARNLHEAARVVAREFAGHLPARYELLLALPGMGPYTAAAVASIAFGEAVAVLDANVERVLARLLRFEEDVRTPAAKRHLLGEAGALLAPRRPGDFNQAMMELGATVCLPKVPRCDACPVRPDCAARATDDPARFPLRKPKPPMEPTREAAAILRRGDTIALLRRPAGRSFGGLWELPRVVCEDGEESRHAAARALREQLGLSIPSLRGPVFRLKHTVMRRRITLLVFEARDDRAPAELETETHEEAAWLLPAEWLDLPKSTTQARLARNLAGEAASTTPPQEGGTDDDLFAQES